MERLRPGDPEQIGPWHVINRLGSGGMGIVYMGTNGTHAAAIKVVRDFLLEDPTSRTRLSREVAALKKVKSKFVAEIVGFDIDATPAWIATNYVDGPSLKTLVENEGPLDEVDWLSLASGIADALQVIHAAGVIHRDIKPTNILMSPTGPRIIDFGISFSDDSTSLTKTGMVAGSPGWFAPEQFLSTKISSAIDIFAAGSSLYFAATGQGPWGKEDTSVASIMHSILNKSPDFSSMTAIQTRILSQMMQRDPSARASASDLQSILDENLNSLNIPNIQRSFSASRKPTKIKYFAIPIALITTLILGSLYFLNGKSSSSNNIKSKIPSGWSINLEGNKEPITGTGSQYFFYICDQSVIKNSLKVIPISPTKKNYQPKISLATKDPRCGTEFDTIEIEGMIDTDGSSQDFRVVGQTTTGYTLNYPFTVNAQYR